MICNLILFIPVVYFLGEVRVAYNIFVGRSEGRRPLGRPRCRWEDNIKMDLREIGFGDVDWIHWAQDRDRWWELSSYVYLDWLANITCNTWSFNFLHFLDKTQKPFFY
jgi:hypothetical protein